MIVKRSDTSSILPFGIDRASKVNFADQVVEGVREAIAVGKYRTGDSLPPLRELAKILGVSTRVTKEALAKLSAMGLVNPRPRLGSVIAPRGTKIWKGRVLLVESRLIQVSYAFGAFELSFRERLNRVGYLVFRSTRDQLDDALCGPIDFAVVVGSLTASLTRKFARAGVPCAETWLRKDDFNGLVEHCLLSGVKRVEQFDLGDGKAMVDATVDMREHGIEIFRHQIRVRQDADCLEHIKRKSMEEMLRRLSDGTPLPDLFYFTDDFIAFGALTALLSSGVRVPEDVRVATFSNRGFGPVFPKTLTRLVNDPWANGAKMADYVLARLAGKNVSQENLLACDYVKGESFP